MTKDEFCEKIRSYLGEVYPGFPDQDYQKIIDVYFEWGALNNIEERKILSRAYFMCWLTALEEKEIRTKNQTYNET